MAVYLGSNQVDLLGGDGIPSAYLIPSGTYSISQNGVYDIGSYKSANVDLPYYEAYKQIMTSDYINASSSIFQSYFNTLSYIRIAQFADLKLNGDFNFPEVVSIGSNAFGHFGYNHIGGRCTFNFPKLQNIPYKAFAYLSNMKEFTASICTSIGQEAFSNCRQLTSINFPNCTSIGTNAFYGCTSLTTMSFPNCTSIGTNAFDGCTSLTTINFPSCSYIREYAFQSCKKLISVDFPNCSYIGAYAFIDCSQLTSVDFPNCNYILDSAFAYCSGLISVGFPNCTSIGSYAFRNCSNLTSVDFPNCSYIAKWAFGYCYNLLSLYLLGSSIPSLVSTDTFSSTPISNYTASTGGVYGSIYVPASLYNSYIPALNWSVYSSRIVGLTDEQMDPIIHCGSVVHAGQMIDTTVSYRMYTGEAQFSSNLPTGSSYVLFDTLKYKDTNGSYHLIANTPGVSFVASANELYPHKSTGDTTFLVGVAVDHAAFMWQLPSGITDVSEVICDYTICEYNA